jgi:hypothetical protein
MKGRKCNFFLLLSPRNEKRELKQIYYPLYYHYVTSHKDHYTKRVKQKPLRTIQPQHMF